MPPQVQHAQIRFGPFTLDLQTRELRQAGHPVKLQDQPGKLLALLVSRAGELVTRAEIEKALWPEGEFVEFEHAVNTAVRKIREALGDDLERPRFIETLPRKGYRFIAAVETSAAARAIIPVDGSASPAHTAPAASAPSPSTPAPQAEAEFNLPPRRARWLFLTVQAGYLAMYCAALGRWEAVQEVLGAALGRAATTAATAVLIVALCGIAVRLYLLSSVGLNHRAGGAKFRQLFPALFVLDALWAMTPLLLVGELGLGLALGAIAPLAYLPFSQRTLVRSIYRKGGALAPPH